VNTVCLAKKNS